MPGGRLRSQLLITSRCLGWCGERGSERGSLPLHHLELNWMSRFLNQRTTAGFNSFSARKPAGSPSSRHRLRCISPACSCPCAWRDRRLPTHLRSAHLSPISHGPTKRGTPTHTQPLTPNPAVPPGGPAPSTLRVGAPAGAQGPRKQQRVISRAIRIFAALFSIPFLSIMAFAVTRDNDNCNFCLTPLYYFILFFF